MCNACRRTLPTVFTLAPGDSTDADYLPYTFFTRLEWDTTAGELLGLNAQSPPERTPAAAPVASAPAPSSATSTVPAKQKRAPNAQTLRIIFLEEEVERLSAEVSSLRSLRCSHVLHFSSKCQSVKQYLVHLVRTAYFQAWVNPQ